MCGDKDKGVRALQMCVCVRLPTLEADNAWAAGVKIREVKAGGPRAPLVWYGRAGSGVIGGVRAGGLMRYLCAGWGERRFGRRSGSGVLRGCWGCFLGAVLVCQGGWVCGSVELLGVCWRLSENVSEKLELRLIFRWDDGVCVFSAV